MQVLVGAGDGGAGVEALAAGDGDHAGSGGEGGVEHSFRTGGHVVAALQHLLGCALGDQRPAAGSLDDDGRAAALVIEADEVALHVAVRRQVARRLHSATSSGLPSTAL